jgi:hypothetical protein
MPLSSKSGESELDALILDGALLLAQFRPIIANASHEAIVGAVVGVLGGTIAKVAAKDKAEARSFVRTMLRSLLAMDKAYDLHALED